MHTFLKNAIGRDVTLMLLHCVIYFVWTGVLTRVCKKNRHGNGRPETELLEAKRSYGDAKRLSSAYPWASDRKCISQKARESVMDDTRGKSVYNSLKLGQHPKASNVCVHLPMPGNLRNVWSVVLSVVGDIIVKFSISRKCFCMKKNRKIEFAELKEVKKATEVVQNILTILKKYR